MREEASWENDNLVLELALRRLRRRSVMDRVFSHPRLFPPAYMLALGLVIALFGWWLSPMLGSGMNLLATGAVTLIVLEVTVVIQQFTTKSSRGAVQWLARELRFSEEIMRDLLLTPLTVSEFVEAMRVWRLREHVGEFRLWSATLLLLSPTLFGWSSGVVPCAIFIAAFMAGFSIARTEETYANSLGAICRDLKRKRQTLTGMPWEALTGDPIRERPSLYVLGCAGLAFAGMAALLLIFALATALVGTPYVSHAPALGLLVGTFLFGLLFGWVVLSLRREDEQENRQAAFLHMDAILEYIREDEQVPQGNAR